MPTRLNLIVNNEIPRDLRRELERRAKASDGTLNDAAVAELSDHFGLKFVPSGARYKPTSAKFRLRVPDRLHDKLRRQVARTPGATMRGVALSILAERLGAKKVDTGRRPRKVSGK